MTTKPDPDEATCVTEDTPANDRRMILVASPARYVELVRAVDWSKAGPALLAAIPALPVLGPLTTGSVVASALARRSTRVRDGLSAVRGGMDRLFRHGEIPLPRVTPAEAGGLFRFPEGEPRDGTAYLLHPHDHRRYLLPATAAVELARERLALFSTVASALGARRIVLVHAEARQSLRGGAMTVPLSDAAAELGLRLASEGQARSAVFREYAAPTAPITFPEEHRAAIERDPELSSLVRERLEARLLSSRVQLDAREVETAAAALAVTLAKRGVRIGGDRAETRASRFVFDVDFWP